MEEVRLICTLLYEINHLLFTLHRVFTVYSCHLCKPINATQLVASLVQAGAAIAPGAGALDDLVWIFQAASAEHDRWSSEMGSLLTLSGPTSRLVARALGLAGPRGIPVLAKFLSQRQKADRHNSAALLSLGQCCAACNTDDPEQLSLLGIATKAIHDAATAGPEMVRIHALVAAQVRLDEHSYSRSLSDSS